MAGPRVATIPPSLPFLPTLARALVEGVAGVSIGREGRDLSHALILVPTRRAASALARALADTLKPRAVLLPRIVPLGDPEAAEEALLIAGREEANLRPALDPLERRLLLAELVARWQASPAARPAREAASGGDLPEALVLAGMLGDLLDSFAIEGVDPRRLQAVDTAGFDDYWALTARFLAIATEAWPKILDERGAMDAIARRDSLLRAEARRLAEERPLTPVIAAGSTGSVPATAALLSVIARLPAGLVVLPGLDTDSDHAVFAAVPVEGDADHPTPGHPQTLLKRLLGVLGVARADVTRIGTPTAALAARARIVAEAMRPTAVTDGWLAVTRRLGAERTDALADVHVIEAADAREEAVAIAIVLREAIEDPAATAILVTPDRALAERVCLTLRRLGVEAEDTAGTRAFTTEEGRLFPLLLAALGDDLTPPALLSLLRHPAVVIPGFPADALAEATTALDLAGFRAGGRIIWDAEDPLAALAATLQADPAATRQPPPIRRVGAPARAKALALLRTVVDLTAPWRMLVAQRSAPLAAWAATFRNLLDAFTDGRLTSSVAGATLIARLDQIAGNTGGPVAQAFEARRAIHLLLDEVTLPASGTGHGRVRILGLLEARLLSADVIVLGGLDEGLWPAAAGTDAFLNRPMRATLGLPPPERRIGQAAHDWLMAMGAPKVVMTRAINRGGTPQVPSRLLRRLDAVIGVEAAQSLRREGERWLALARALDARPPLPSVTRPDPRPPAARQPTRLSVTRIATLYRDPYAIFASAILRLEPLPPLVAEPGARERGTVIHRALELFADRTVGGWPQDPEALLLDCGREAFAALTLDPAVHAFWWRRFEKNASFLAAWLSTRRDNDIAVEVDGRLTLTLADGTPFLLTARADRIERAPDGSLAIIDAKTGKPPTAEQVTNGREPQLTLQAAIAMAGGFPTLPAGAVSELLYLDLSDRSGGKMQNAIPKDAVIADLAEAHLNTLANVLNEHRRGARGFLSRRAPFKTSVVGDYDHLARVREWSLAGEDAGPGDS